MFILSFSISNLNNFIVNESNLICSLNYIAVHFVKLKKAAILINCRPLIFEIIFECNLNMLAVSDCFLESLLFKYNGFRAGAQIDQMSRDTADKFFRATYIKFLPKVRNVIDQEIAVDSFS